jgi:hypothetical protein
MITGRKGEGVPEASESFAMPPVFETSSDGEEIFDPEDVEDDAFDRANETVRPEPEPIGSDPRENHVAAIEHIERAVRKLGYVYSCSVVLRLALDGQKADQDYEIADCLNRQVTTEVGRVIYRLVREARRLGADIPNPIEP